jgi:arylsulfatase A-like enzyme
MKRLCLAVFVSFLLPALGADRPNVLFILVDDFGARDPSCCGSALHETPHMDALAASGACFSHAYVAYPRCVPSRYAIMTGRHPARVQGRGDSPHIEPGRDVTIGRAFKDAGYRTFYAGKWHLGEGASAPDKNGFEFTIAAGAAGAARSHFAPYNDSRRKGGGGEEKDPIVGLDDAPEGEHLTDRLTDETLKFIRGHKGEPFFAVLAHYAVHTPLQARPDLVKRFRDKLARMKLPEKPYEKESAGENLTVQNNATYAAMISSVDEGVGRILSELEKLSLDDNTIIVLMGDHGGLSARGNQREVATSNRPLRAGKGHLYEGGLRVPLFIRWPGRVKPGTQIAEPVVSMDLFPTLLEAAGIKSQTTTDGLSLTTLLTGGAAQAREALYWHNSAPRPGSTGDLFSSAIRAGNLKLVEFPEEHRVELYDLAKDPGEAQNLAADRPADRERLQTLLNKWRSSVGASTEGKIRKKDREGK